MVSHNKGQDRHSPCPPGACTPGTYTIQVAFPQLPLLSQCFLLWHRLLLFLFCQLLLLKSNPIQMPPLLGHLHWRSQQQCHSSCQAPVTSTGCLHISWGVMVICFELQMLWGSGGFSYKTTISWSAGWLCPSLAFQSQPSWHTDLLTEQVCPEHLWSDRHCSASGFTTVNKTNKKPYPHWHPSGNE